MRRFLRGCKKYIMHRKAKPTEEPTKSEREQCPDIAYITGIRGKKKKGQEWQEYGRLG